MTTSDAYKAFAAGTVAMSIGHRWVANDCAKLIQADSLGVAPLPRDPDADQYYTEEEGGGFYVSKGAPNLQGAIACCNVYAYVIRSKAYIRDQYEYNIDNGVWTEELQKQYERNNQLVGVLRNWESFNMGDYWGDLFSRPAAESRGKPSRRSFLPRWTPGSRSFTRPRNKEYCAVNGGCDGLLFTAQYTCCQ